MILTVAFMMLASFLVAFSYPSTFIVPFFLESVKFSREQFWRENGEFIPHDIKLVNIFDSFETSAKRRQSRARPHKYWDCGGTGSPDTKHCQGRQKNFPTILRPEKFFAQSGPGGASLDNARCRAGGGSSVASGRCATQTLYFGRSPP